MDKEDWNLIQERLHIPPTSEMKPRISNLPRRSLKCPITTVTIPQCVLTVHGVQKWDLAVTYTPPSTRLHAILIPSSPPHLYKGPPPLVTHLSFYRSFLCPAIIVASGADTKELLLLGFEKYESSLVGSRQNGRLTRV